jgi:hypothetical protein
MIEATMPAPVANRASAAFALPKRRRQLSASTQNEKAPPKGEARKSIDPEAYSMIEATMPAPTVRPPSRMAKRSFSSMAIGTISVTSAEMLSPGITISVPSGSVTTPVTSVVRK